MSIAGGTRDAGSPPARDRPPGGLGGLGRLGWAGLPRPGRPSHQPKPLPRLADFRPWAGLGGSGGFRPLGFEDLHPARGDLDGAPAVAAQVQVQAPVSLADAMRSVGVLFC